MTPDRLRECLGALNWSTAALAAMAQVSPVTARRWLNGQREIPSKVAAGIVTLTFVRQPEVGDDFATHITLRFGRMCPAARH
jgi:transcriptional regulator with XRE-family HTH domain